MAHGFGAPRESSMIGEVISIGDELASGQRLDTNSQWLSERLGELGVRVLYHATVADDLEAGVSVFEATSLWQPAVWGPRPTT